MKIIQTKNPGVFSVNIEKISNLSFSFKVFTAEGKRISGGCANYTNPPKLRDLRKHAKEQAIRSGLKHGIGASSKGFYCVSVSWE